MRPEVSSYAVLRPPLNEARLFFLCRSRQAHYEASLVALLALSLVLVFCQWFAVLRTIGSIVKRMLGKLYSTRALCLEAELLAFSSSH